MYFCLISHLIQLKSFYNFFSSRLLYHVQMDKNIQLCYVQEIQRFPSKPAIVYNFNSFNIMYELIETWLKNNNIKKKKNKLQRKYRFRH